MSEGILAMLLVILIGGATLAYCAWMFSYCSKVPASQATKLDEMICGR